MFAKIGGIIGGKLQLGFYGTFIKSLGLYDMAVRDYLGINNARLAVLRPQDDDQATTLLDLKERDILIEFDFNGGAAPAPGTNTGKYGFCRATGGPYLAGQVVYDNGAALVLVSIYKMQNISTTSAIMGAVSLIANGAYIAQSAAPPYSWTLKGDGTGAGVGSDKTIAIVLSGVAGAGNFDATTPIPAGAVIKSVDLNVTNPFDAFTTVEVQIDVGGVPPPQTVMATTDNNTQLADVYETTPFLVANGGTLRAIVAGPGPFTTGDAIVYVTFCVPLA
jgi:hypothetical protein